MNRSHIVALFAASCLVTAPGVLASSGPKSPRPAKVASHGPNHTHPQGRAAGRHDTGQSSRHAPGEAKPAKPRHEPETIASRISKNPKLEARVEAMLPSGMTLEQASAGFRNQGQFIAALNASKEHNIPFVDLKREMTGEHPLSLGQAIQKLKPASSTSGSKRD